MKIIPTNSEEKTDKEISSTVNLNCNKYSIENEQRMEVYKGARTFGLLLVGGANDQQVPGDSGIYVSKVLEGGLAELDGRIYPGDRITAVKRYLEDGDAYTFSFDNDGRTTHEDAKQILRRCKGRVALFIVRKDELLETRNKTPYQTSQRAGMDPIIENATKTLLTDNDLSDHNKEAKEPDHIIGNKNENKLILSSQPSRASSLSGHIPAQIDQSRVRLVNVTPLIKSRSWTSSLAPRSNNCSTDYRDMAKYGIRPTSSFLCTDMIQPINKQVKDHHRIKKNWVSSKISSLSIREDDEEEHYSSSLPQVQKQFELEMEQRVL